MHLLVNAAQSTPPGSKATHSVRVSSGTDEKGWASVEVADSGTGIPAAARPRIFEPLFSTRPVGGGVGLGLSVCYGIVTGLGGTIDVTSEEGHGTTVRRRPRRPGQRAPREVTTAGIVSKQIRTSCQNDQESM